MSLNDYFQQIVFDRSLRGWRTVRPGGWEALVAILWTLAIIYALAATASAAIGSKCLIDPNANSCNGWVDHIDHR